MKGIAIRAGILLAIVMAIVWHASGSARSRDALMRDSVGSVAQAR